MAAYVLYGDVSIDFIEQCNWRVIKGSEVVSSGHECRAIALREIDKEAA